MDSKVETEKDWSQLTSIPKDAGIVAPEERGGRGLRTIDI